MKGRKLYSSSTETRNLLAVIILSFVVSVIPLIVYMKVVPLDGIMKLTWSGNDTHPDFFSYWKSQYIILCSALLLILVVYSLIKYKLSFRKMFAPLFIYAMMVVLSSIFSEYRDVAFNGFVDRFEGALVLLGYVIFALSAALAVRDEKMVRPVLISLFVSCVIMTVLGLTQFYDADFFKTEIGRKLIMPKIYEDSIDSLRFVFGDMKIMYTTVYNPNYAGSYSALLFPVAVALYYNWAGKGIWKTLIGMIFVSFTFILLIGSLSRAALLGSFAAGIIFVVIFRKKIIKLWPYTLALTIVLSGIYTAMDITSGGLIVEEAKNTLPSAIRYDISKDVSGKVGGNYPAKRIETIDINGVSLTIKTESESFTVTHNRGTLLFTGSNGELLDWEFDGEKYQFKDEKYALYNVRIKKADRFDIVWENIPIPIMVKDNQLYIEVNNAVAINEIEEPETFGFIGMEMFASSRGYIWSRSIPMLKKTLILGHGPDTYVIYFPQKEITAKINFMDNATIIVDKPHNWYLQMGINTGVISLIAMLVFLGWYIIKGFLVWVKDVGNAEKSIGASILCGVVGYCTAALFNDSTVSVAPVFWVLLGIGISFLYKYSPSEKKA